MPIKLFKLISLVLCLSFTHINMAYALEKIVNCTAKGKPLFGKVKVVEHFPDLKVQVVTAFPDLKVQLVQNWPDKCGKWQMVENFPDLKIQFVEAFPDIKIQYVQNFPGLK